MVTAPVGSSFAVISSSYIFHTLAHDTGMRHARAQCIAACMCGRKPWRRIAISGSACAQGRLCVAVFLAFPWLKACPAFPRSAAICTPSLGLRSCAEHCLSEKLFTACLWEVFRELGWETSGMGVNGEKLRRLSLAVRMDVVLLVESGEDHKARKGCFGTCAQKCKA